MARSSDTLITIAIVAVGLYIAYLLFTQKGGVLDAVSKSGAIFGSWLQGLWLNSSAYKATAVETQVRAGIQGLNVTLVSVPETPEGFAPSNWTWAVGGGTMLGLPPGMTPAEFCQQSPSAPVCAQLKGV